MNFKKSSNIFVIWSAIIFIGLFLFLTVINPLTVYDTDDWLYIGQFRRPIPMIGHWNPIKVFPETFMPLFSYFGVKIINPIIHNYCYSLTLAHGLFSSMVLSLYFVEFSLLFYRKKLASMSRSIGYGALFILLHFIAYIHSGSNNIFLIWSEDLTCFYNYTLSTALNASLIMHSISYGGMRNLFKKSSILHKIIIFVWLYFAIFSNLYSSVVLAAYIGGELLIDLISSIQKHSFSLKDYCINNIMNMLIILCWFGSNLLETTGGRADDLGKSPIANIPPTLLYGLTNVIAINIFITILGIVVGILWIRKHERFKLAAIKFVVYFALTVAYLVLLSAAVEPHYIFRAEVAFCFFFYLFLALIAALNELISLNKKYTRLLLILFGTVILLFINPGKVFFAYNNSNISYKQCEVLMNDLISQFQAAEQNGLYEISLEVPAYDVMYNWPLADFAGDNIAIALYNHNIVNTQISVKEMVPSRTKNEQFEIDEFNLEENLKNVYLY